MTDQQQPTGTACRRPPKRSRAVHLVPNEGTAQLVDVVRITRGNFGWEFTLSNARGVLVIESAHRTFRNSFAEYGDAAAHANEFIRQNHRRVDHVVES